MQFTEHGIEGVVPVELLPPEVRSKYQGKPSDRSKRAKEETKTSVQQAEENQVAELSKFILIFLMRFRQTPIYKSDSPLNSQIEMLH